MEIAQAFKHKANPCEARRRNNKIKEKSNWEGDIPVFLKENYWNVNKFLSLRKFQPCVKRGFRKILKQEINERIFRKSK